MFAHRLNVILAAQTKTLRTHFSFKEVELQKWSTSHKVIRMLFDVLLTHPDKLLHNLLLIKAIYIFLRGAIEALRCKMLFWRRSACQRYSSCESSPCCTEQVVRDADGQVDERKTQPQCLLCRHTLSYSSSQHV